MSEAEIVGKECFPNKSRDFQCIDDVSKNIDKLSRYRKKLNFKSLLHPPTLSWTNLSEKSCVRLTLHYWLYFLYFLLCLEVSEGYIFRKINPFTQNVTLKPPFPLDPSIFSRNSE